MYIYIYACIFINIYIYIYKYIYVMLFSNEEFFEVAIESCPESDLNP